MVKRGLGLAIFPEPLIPKSARGKVAIPYPLTEWQLCLFRKDREADLVCDAVEKFLVSTVLGDPDYPTIAYDA